MRTLLFFAHHQLIIHHVFFLRFIIRFYLSILLTTIERFFFSFSLNCFFPFTFFHALRTGKTIRWVKQKMLHLHHGIQGKGKNIKNLFLSIFCSPLPFHGLTTILSHSRYHSCDNLSSSLVIRQKSSGNDNDWSNWELKTKATFNLNFNKWP